MDLLKRKHNNILLHVVSIGERKVSIPVATLGSGEGKRILITAGLDGDEYAGIEAAYALIDYFAKQKVKDRITIIPIVNIPGFENATSWNPLDNKYPKHIFPGKEKGSSTERLMFWLSNNFVKDIDLWIDLHSGASTEVLDPFVEVMQTKYTSIQDSSKEYISKIKANKIIFDSKSTQYSESISKRKITRVVLESGQLGQRNKNDSRQHIDWVKQLISENKKPKNTKKEIWENVREFLSEKNAIWVPTFLGKTIKKSQVLGELRSLDGKVLQKVTAKENGIFLWRREAMHCKKYDSLYAYAYGKSYINA